MWWFAQFSFNSLFHSLWNLLGENTDLKFVFTLQKLPKAPLLFHLSLQQNNIQSLSGLEVLRKTGVQSLVLKGNPIELDPNYREQ